MARHTDARDERLAAGRTAYSERHWTVGYRALSDADRAAPLDHDDLERAGTAAHLIGEDAAAVEFWERAYRAADDAGDAAATARHAFQIGMMLLQGGEPARGSGWLGRASRIVEEDGLDCVEAGLVLVPGGIEALASGDPVSALARFDRVADIGERFGDPDLRALGRLGRGRSLLDLGEVPRAMALLDEAMLAVTSDEVSPIIVGTVYCAAIEAFQAIFDLRRAQEWTTALRAWCETQPDLVPFRGRCLVYRAEVLRLHGAWAEAIEETRLAADWLSRPPPEPAVGEAIYARAELHRLQGEWAEAEAAYRGASRWGRRPEPGLALLRLAQGRADAASAMMRRALDETPDGPARAGLLEPSAEIALATGDVEAARAVSVELDRIAELVGVPPLDAIAARLRGVLLLIDEDPAGALAAFRFAARVWSDVDAPYELARIRECLGRAMRAMSDRDGADLEFDAARRVFESLGARPDLARLDATIAASDEPAGDAPATTGSETPGGLTPREVEILRLVAGGGTNRAIATELGISERTVDRHVSNVFDKLGVSTRAAATAYAYEHDLV